MNRILFLLVLLPLAGLLLQAGGCVTAHEGTVSLKIIKFPGGEAIKDSFLLTVHSETLESKGRWWLFEEEGGGNMIPHAATVKRINTGDKLHQQGHMVTTIGPYAKSTIHGWEYWVFHKGYQPDDFLDIHFDRAYEDDKPLQVSLAEISPGNEYSDEKVLDGARKFCEVLDFLPNHDPDAQLLKKLVSAQLRAVNRHSPKPRNRQDAGELLQELEKEGYKFVEDKRFPEKK